jgi:N-acetylneuraminic acid mutarotase
LRIVTTVLVLVILLASSMLNTRPVFGEAINKNTWATKAPMHVARANLGVAVVDGYVYAIGGNTISGAYNFDQGFSGGFSGGMVDTNERYDPATDNWTFRASMPTPRDCFAIAAYQGKIYCIGGRTAISSSHKQTFTAVNEVYDPANDTWKTKTPIQAADWPLQANVVNDKIYVMGGTGATYAYDPATDTWSVKARAPLNSPYGLTNHWEPSFVAVAFDDKIYAVGGISANDYYGALNVIYDTSTDTWSEAKSTPLFSGGYFDLGTGSLGAGGATTGALSPKQICIFFENRAFIYDPTRDSWKMGATSSSNRWNLAVAMVNDTFYVIGGANEPQGFYTAYGPLAVNEQYVPPGYGTPDPSYVRYMLEHTPPEISVLSPANQTYNESSVPLVFTVNKQISCMGYCLDGAQNVTITGNVTIANVTNGLHSITVYANDTFGNMGVSETMHFSVEVPEVPEPFPTLLLVAASGASIALVGMGLVVYFKKRKR